jgi:putative ABC transport system permease protein
VRTISHVRDIELRPILAGRVRVGKDTWVPLMAFVVRDFNDVRIDRFVLDSGAWPREGELVIERSGMSVAGAKVGDTIEAQINGRDERMRIAGTVHAAGLAPGWMDHVVAGFVPWRATADPSLRVTLDVSDEARIGQVAQSIAAELRKDGVTVRRIEIPPPGRHPHADQMETFLFLLGAFGALTLVLSAVLVANMVHALLANQLRHIGVMKAIGASTRQIVSMSLAHVAILATLSLLIAMPLALSTGRAYARFAATMLNATLTTVSVPVWVLLTQIAVGLLVPVAVALIPIVRTSRISIHQALGNDLAGQAFGTRAFDRWLSTLRFLPRTLMLSLRSTFHRRGRLLLTVATLAIGGAVFIAALNVSASWSRSIAVDFEAHRYDVDVRLSDPVDTRQLARTIEAIPDVTRVESWLEVRQDHDTLIGLDVSSPLLALPLIEGRWLRGDDEVVINQALAATKPAFASARIVGIVREIGSGPTAYASRATVMRMANVSDARTRNAHVVTRSHSAATAQEIERVLQRAGFPVGHVQRLTDRRQAIEDHLVIIKSVLFFASTLVVLVGALGLMSTLTLNVVSRTRELGVLSAIGALPRTIASHIVFEGVLIGVLSWCVAVLVSMPATWLIDRATGRIFIKTPVEFLIAPEGVATWLALVILLGALSSFYPAWRSTRISVREALSYE